MTHFLQDDPEWFWVQRPDGPEGFVPAGFIYPLDAIQKQRKFDVFPADLPRLTSPPSSDHLSLPGPGLSLTSGNSAPPPPPPLSSSGGGSGPSSLSPGNLGYTTHHPHHPHHPHNNHNSNGGKSSLSIPCLIMTDCCVSAVPPPLPSQSSQTTHNSVDFRYSGSELVMLYDYKVRDLVTDNDDDNDDCPPGPGT